MIQFSRFYLLHVLNTSYINYKNCIYIIKKNKKQTFYIQNWKNENGLLVTEDMFLSDTSSQPFYVALLLDTLSQFSDKYLYIFSSRIAFENNVLEKFNRDMHTILFTIWQKQKLIFYNNNFKVWRS